METATLDHGLDSNEQPNQARDDLLLENLSTNPEHSRFLPGLEVGRALHVLTMFPMFSIPTGVVIDLDQLQRIFQQGKHSDIRDLSSSGAVIPRDMSFRIEEEATKFVPRTALTKRLWELRQKIVASGRPLLDWEDLEREVRERRGERNPGEES